MKFDTNLTKLDMYVPFASIADPTVPAVKPNVDGPETVTPVVHTFAAGNNAATQLTQTGVGSVNDAALFAGGGGLGTTVFTRSLDSQVSRLGTGGDAQILYVDWSAYDPSISLFGTLTPALPAAGRSARRRGDRLGDAQRLHGRQHLRRPLESRAGVPQPHRAGGHAAITAALND